MATIGGLKETGALCDPLWLGYIDRPSVAQGGLEPLPCLLYPSPYVLPGLSVHV